MGDRIILVVEDHADSREMLVDLLECRGYSVTGAENGRAALEALEGGLRPALILLDLTMPVMDGWQLAAEIAKREEWAAIPIVVVSAVQGVPAPAGCRGFLAKPVDLSALMEVVLLHCGGRPG